MEKTTNEIDITQEDIMREALSILLESSRNDNEFTMEMFTKWFPDGSGKRNFHQLEKLVKAGILKKRKIIENGHLANAYSPVDGDWKDIVDKLR